MDTETINTYLQAFGTICVILVPYLVIKLYLLGESYEKLFDKYTKVVDQRDTFHGETSRLKKGY